MKLQRLAILLAMAAVAAFGQSPSKSTNVPRTADGHPDLEGLWTNRTMTPVQRPAELGSKEFFTEQEAAAYEKAVLASSAKEENEGPKAGNPGTYNQAFYELDGSHVEKTRRTSLVVDPVDGKIPPYTPEAQARLDAYRNYLKDHAADGPEDRDLTERCLAFMGSGPPMLPEPYNNNYEIGQSPGYVAILAEANHDVRIIPTTALAGLSAAVAEWHGVSRGHWEGDTLVVETTNVKYNDHRFGRVPMADANMQVTERFTRTAPDTIMYRATVVDPTIYAKPWTVEEVWSKTAGPLFEYACHEGNYAMSGILGGARAEEKKAAGK